MLLCCGGCTTLIDAPHCLLCRVDHRLRDALSLYIVLYTRGTCLIPAHRQTWTFRLRILATSTTGHPSRRSAFRIRLWTRIMFLLRFGKRSSPSFLVRPISSMSCLLQSGSTCSLYAPCTTPSSGVNLKTSNRIFKYGQTIQACISPWIGSYVLSRRRVHTMPRAAGVTTARWTSAGGAISRLICATLRSRVCCHSNSCPP